MRDQSLSRELLFAKRSREKAAVVAALFEFDQKGSG
jgi:hypothetical protein